MRILPKVLFECRLNSYFVILYSMFFLSGVPHARLAQT